MIDSETLHAIAAGRVAPPGLVSIVLPHFETPELARLCLRAVRRFTDTPFEMLVVDNGSRDGASLEYLRGVSWIRLVARPAGRVPESGPEAHAAALNLGLAESRGELLLAMHTDTIPRRAGWLAALKEPFATDARLAVVGADKLDAPGVLAAALKTLGDGKAWRRLGHRLTGRAIPEALRPRTPHARSFCALYRRAVLVDEKLDFTPHFPYAAGENLYHELLARGYHARLLSPRDMGGLVLHVVHATAYLSPRRTIRTGRVRRRTARRMARLMSAPWVHRLLEDDSLDR